MQEAISCFMKYFRRLSQLADEWKRDMKMVNALINIQTGLVRPFFSRVLSADLSIGEFVDVMRNMQPHMRLVREGKMKKFMIILGKIPVLYPIASFMYRYVFMTMVYPYLSKN